MGQSGDWFWLDSAFRRAYRYPKIGHYRLLILDGNTSHASLQFVKYCQDHNIIPLCLPRHSAHELQPLARKYKQLISERRISNARRIDNLEILLIYQQARQTIKNNIPDAWRGAGLVPYDSDKICASYRPVIAPFVSFIDRFGRKVDLAVDEETGRQTNNVVGKLLDVYDVQSKQGAPFMQGTRLTALEDRSTLHTSNQGFVEKARQRGKQNHRKHGEQARSLTDADIEEEKAERKAMGSGEPKVNAKARRAALRRVVGFARMVWKEMPVSYDVFE